MRWALSGNLCRCTGYQNIVKSVLWAAAKQRGEAAGVTATQDEPGARRDQDRRAWAPAASGSRTTGSSAARATTSTTSCCPGMLHMEILRSPLAHARIMSIDTSKAWEIPGVRLVLTGEMMATRNLAWMPTLSYDTQAVLATDKVRFQGQEVACVIADDPYIAKDALRGDRRRLRAAAGDRQPDPGDGRGRAADPRRQGEPARQRRASPGRWATGTAPTGAFAQADLVSKLELHYPRSHPSPMECCGSIADFNRSTSKLTVYMTTPGAAHHPGRGGAGRRAARAHDPDRLARTSAAASATRCRSTRATSCRSWPRSCIERPVKWIEDKTGNLISTGFAPRRLPRRRAGAAQGRQDPRRPDAHRLRPRRVLLRRPAEQVQDRADALGVRLLRHPGRAPHRPRRLHQQGARRRRLPVLVPGHRGDVLPGAHGPGGRRRPRHGPGRVPPASTSSATTTSRTGRRSASSPTPASTASASTSGWRRSATTTSCKQKEEATQAGPAARHRHLDDDRAARAPATAASTTSSASRCSTPPSCGCT